MLMMEKTTNQEKENRASYFVSLRTCRFYSALLEDLPNWFGQMLKCQTSFVCIVCHFQNFLRDSASTTPGNTVPLQYKVVNVGKARLKSGLFRKPTEYLTQSNIFALMSLRDHRLGAAFRKSGRSILQAQLHSLDLAILMEGFPNECTLIWILEVHAFSKPCFFFSPLAPRLPPCFLFQSVYKFSKSVPILGFVKAWVGHIYSDKLLRCGMGVQLEIRLRSVKLNYSEVREVNI